ncbi:MAG: hypothetical protein QOH76_617 [Thermoleophilaceae bacterium]|jgi:uncharacterized protein (DUF1015 family)|nr:hypothetical protein [Thermoleophilaceae bacterium]
MADVQPLRTLRYDLSAVGSLDAVAAPPYDVIDAPLRAELASRSPFNVVEVDLPEANGGDPYLHAQTTMEAWLQQGVVTREREPAMWAMTQDYSGPDGNTYTRHGFFCRVRVEDYGPGRIRPHERTQPGPKEDRLRLTRATRANLSPIFSLFPDERQEAWAALESLTEHDPYATVTDADGTVNRLWRVADPLTITQVQDVLRDRELLIADGHHRYETARVYEQEVGGEGAHSYVLMFLCSLQDSGLTIFPTHRLLKDLDENKRAALRQAIERHFEVGEVSADELEPPEGDRVEFGYLDAFHKRPLRLTLKDQSSADEALDGHSDAYRHLDTAVLEALVLKGALGMSEDDVANKRGLGYSKDFADAREAVESGRADAAFFMRATPVEQVRAVAEAGESMPPKSTFFYPKIPTGLVFNPLD